MKIRIDDIVPRVGVDDVLNVEEMRRRARRRLPRAIFDAIDGGAGDETSVRGNREAYSGYWLRPKPLVDISSRSLKTTILGDELSLPIMLGPCGFARMCAPDGELAIARAAGAAETLYAVTGAPAYPLEEIQRAATGPTWYQFYPPESRQQTEEELRRIKAAGYRVLCVTVDTAIAPVRDRDYYNKLSVPLKISPALILHGLSRPTWAREFLLGRMGQMQPGQVRVQVRQFAQMIARVRGITLEELVWMKEVFGGPLVVKGIMRGDGVGEMIDAGVDGIVVSNHGGRNLDGARPTLDSLPEVVEAASGRAEVFLDGGIRRGTDVLKALALGARAVLIGRPYMFGLAAYGEPGVRRVIQILRLELEYAMGLTGCPTIADIDSTIVVPKRPNSAPAQQARDGSPDNWAAEALHDDPAIAGPSRGGEGR
jgi:isopentenyl diphosphate isomerase/L-lactate dehydrogenase-like FMN-dependent dehydrogenase